MVGVVEGCRDDELIGAKLRSPSPQWKAERRGEYLTENTTFRARLFSFQPLSNFNLTFNR